MKKATGYHKMTPYSDMEHVCLFRECGGPCGQGFHSSGVHPLLVLVCEFSSFLLIENMCNLCLTEQKIKHMYRIQKLKKDLNTARA